MDPLTILTFVRQYWKLALFALLLAALGAQSYRLQGAQGELAVLAEREAAQLRAQQLRALHNLRNKERTDEEYAAAQRRAAAVVVRVEPTGVTSAPTPAVGGDGATVCFDRGRLNEELAGWVERHARRLTAALAAAAQLGNRRFTDVARESEGVAAAYRACRSFAVNLEDASGAGAVGEGPGGTLDDRPAPEPR